MEQKESTTVFEPGQLTHEDDPKRMITIGKGDVVTLEEIWLESDPLCRYCRKGLQEVPGAPRRVCGCAIRNIMRRRHGQTPSAPMVQVERGKVGQDRAKQKLARLRKEADKQRSEMERRTKDYDVGVDEALAAVAREEAELQQAVLGCERVATDMLCLEAAWAAKVRAHEEGRAEEARQEAQCRRARRRAPG